MIALMGQASDWHALTVRVLVGSNRRAARTFGASNTATSRLEPRRG